MSAAVAEELVETEAAVVLAQELRTRREALVEQLNMISAELEPSAIKLLLREQTKRLLNPTAVARLAKAAESGDAIAERTLTSWARWAQAYSERLDMVEAAITTAQGEVEHGEATESLGL